MVAIERSDGLLVDRLLESGVRVLALLPNQVKAVRDRFRASGGSQIGLTVSCCASSRGPMLAGSGSLSLEGARVAFRGTAPWLVGHGRKLRDSVAGCLSASASGHRLVTGLPQGD